MASIIFGVTKFELLCRFSAFTLKLTYLLCCLFNKCNFIIIIIFTLMIEILRIMIMVTIAIAECLLYHTFLSTL